MKKTLSNLFMVNLAIWFLTSGYISLNSFVGFFVTTDPYIAKFLSAISFLTLVILGSYNYYKTGNVTNNQNGAEINIGNQKSSPSGCRTCKNRK